MADDPFAALEQAPSAFMFRLRWQGRVVAEFAEVSGLEFPEPQIRQAGKLPVFKLPGIPKYSSVTLKRGLCHDREFEDWASHKDGDASPRPRLPLKLELLDEARRLSIRFCFDDCFVTSMQSHAEPAPGGGVTVERLTIDYESLQIDDSASGD